MVKRGVNRCRGGFSCISKIPTILLKRKRDLDLSCVRKRAHSTIAYALAFSMGDYRKCSPSPCEKSVAHDSYRLRRCLPRLYVAYELCCYAVRKQPSNAVDVRLSKWAQFQARRNYRHWNLMLGTWPQ
jgi:hypothetical protein